LQHHVRLKNLSIILQKISAVAKESGFSPHAGVAAEAWERRKLERLDAVQQHKDGALGGLLPGLSRKAGRVVGEVGGGRDSLELSE
jgi:phage tail tape-measure protein